MARTRRPVGVVPFESLPCQLVVRLPLHIESAANLREHQRARARRVASQRCDVGLLLAPSRDLVTLPTLVRMTRIAPCELDDDNLVAAFKSVRDEITRWLGLPNDRDPRVQWRPAQRCEAPRTYGLELVFLRGGAR